MWELAKQEPMYKAALPLLRIAGDPEGMGNSNKTLDDMDVQLNQWSLNLRKIVQLLDPSSILLKMSRDD